MKYTLNSKTKESIEKTIGLSFEEIISMDSTEMKEHIENKISKPMEFSKNDLRVPIKSSVYLFHNRFLNKIKE